MKKNNPKKIAVQAILLFSLILFTNFSFAQIKTDSSFQKKIKLNTIIIGYYAKSTDPYTDVQTGIHNVKSDSGVVNNSFTMRYIRVQGNYDLTPSIDANILVNFAELKNPNADFHKVIEMAYARYKFFPAGGYLTLQVGQFRPYTQLEDMYGIQFHRSYYWSNQYLGLSSSNWTSFQVGAALTGSLKKMNIPLNYYLTVWNGNGRVVTAVNSAAQTNGDNDNNKNFALRLEYEPIKDIIVGVAESGTHYQGKAINNFNADIRAKHSFTKKWDAELEASYSSGNDVSAIIAATGTEIPASSINYSNYIMRGIYVIPLVRYNTPASKVKSTELTCRYEYWKQDVLANNPRTTIAPMINFNLADNYGARFQLFGILNSYKKQVTNVNSAVYNANQIVAQVQFFF